MRPATNRNLNQRMRMALYSLKRDYGASIDIYKLVDSTTDVRTGEKQITKTVTHVRRAIVVPTKIDRIAQQTISLISANKEFVTGGHWDASQRDFIIDRRDVPSLPELTADDWIVFNNRKYQVKTVEAFEYDAGWVITARELVGEVPEQIFDLRAESYLDLTDEAALSYVPSGNIFVLDAESSLALSDDATFTL